MPYVKEPAPVGAALGQLVRYYDRELEKLDVDSQEQNALLEAINIVGVNASWFWEDTILGEPSPGAMRADTNTMGGFTLINVNFEDAQGKSIAQLLKTSTIEQGDLLGLIATSGTGAGNYLISGTVVFFDNFIQIPVSTFRGRSDNPQVDDIMAMRWEFSTAPPQAVL